jgi:hypothetical protein
MSPFISGCCYLQGQQRCERCRKLQMQQGTLVDNRRPGFNVENTGRSCRA